MNKRDRVKRFFALLLTFAMIFQQAGITTIADETEAVVTQQSETAEAKVQASAPETNAPETKAPETQAPETKAPETSAPETKAPETKAPETSAPETQAAETNAPETLAPATETPQAQAPETSAASESETKATETEVAVTEAPETNAPETGAVESETATEETVAESESQKEEYQNSFSWKNEKITVKVDFTDTRAMSAKASFEVEKITSEMEKYASVMNQVDEFLAGQGESTGESIVYDMTFKENGKEIYTNQKAEVTLRFASPITLAGTGMIKVLHVKDGVSAVTKNVDVNADGSINAVTFVTNGFSPFVVTKTNELIENQMIATLSDITSDSETVNQGVTVNVGVLEGDHFLSEITGKTGQRLTATINFTNSTPKDEHGEEEGKNNRTVRISFSQLEPDIELDQTVKEDGTFKITIHTSDNQDLVINAKYNKEGRYIDYSIPAGATGSFEIHFDTKNGTTIGDDTTKVVLTPSIPNSTSENDHCSGPATLKWTADFGWEPVDKKVNNQDSNTIAVDEAANKLTGTLQYDVKAISKNRDDVGAIWTEKIEVTDELTLPEGFSFPLDKMTIDKESGTISYDGQTVFKLPQMQGGTVEELSCDGKKISYKLSVPNPKKDEVGTLTGEMDNLALKAELDASWIKIPDNYLGAGDVIKNHVKIDPKPNVGTKEAKSEDEVETKTEGPTEDFIVEKTSSKENTTVKAGEEVPYTITLTNKGRLDLAASDENGKEYELTDYLPNELYLTEAQQAAIREQLGDKCVEITDRKIVLKPGVIKEGGKFEVTFNATVANLDVIKNSEQIDNYAEYRGRGDHSVLPLDKPEIEIKKEGNRTSLKNGEEITYTVSVTNKENYDVTYEEVVTDQLPKGLTLEGVINDKDEEITLENNKSYDNVTINGQQVSIRVDQDGRATITWKAGTLKASETKCLSYTCKFDLDKADKGNEKDGTITVRNTANANYAGSDSYDFTSDTGKVGIAKNVTGATKDGETVSSPYADGTIVSYEIVVTNDKNNPYPADKDVIVEDRIPFGLFPIGLTLEKDGQTIEIHSKSELASYVNMWSSTKMKLDGQDVEVTLGNEITIKWNTGKNLDPGESRTIRYSAKIIEEESGKSGEFKLTNTANSGKASDSAEIIVKGGAVENDKKILLPDGSEATVIELEENSEVTYLLKLTNPTGRAIKVSGAYDKLPCTK
ncbi:MAG: isopeptide-forming domain-containing fimbrial protein, partial [Lachnospiraceae bacterium]|nr:isopeptide-forming domain-containing fimbrial protein [Lachnospiraceae bacterium]